jgi:hypothetical protein
VPAAGLGVQGRVKGAGRQGRSSGLGSCLCSQTLR